MTTGFADVYKSSRMKKVAAFRELKQIYIKFQPEDRTVKFIFNVFGDSKRR